MSTLPPWKELLRRPVTILTGLLSFALLAWWFLPAAGRKMPETSAAEATPPSRPAETRPAETRAAVASSPAATQADRAPSSFRFHYAADSKRPLREWEQIDDNTWEETYPDGRTTRFLLVGPSEDPKDPGIILTRLPGKDMEVFVPLLSNPDKRLGWRYPKDKRPKDAPSTGGPEWYTLGVMEDAE